MSEILVGFDDTAAADDALAFATRVARGTGSSLRIVVAHPSHDVSRAASDEASRDYEQRDAGAALGAAAESVEGVDVATEAIADVSPPHALQTAAVRRGAALVVVGSTHRGAIGRMLPGSTGERLLHSSPCAVAIAPQGYAKRSETIATIGVGYDASEESNIALAAASGLARQFGARLRVIHVFDASRVGRPALMTGPAWTTMRDEHEGAQREELEAAVAALSQDVDAEARFVVGRPAQELARESEAVDVLVVGSRGYGPLTATLAGGVSHALLRRATCPVIVLPRRMHHGVEALFASAAQAAV
jgi:nucleotide-binding universal stress UspA family protein